MPSRPGARKATRADVARRADVSETTVAYVIGGSLGVRIREETADRVRAAAKELGYSPSFSARSMRRGRTDLIGILIPGLHAQFHPFYSEMIHSICAAAADSEYQFLYLMRDQEAKCRRCLSRGYVDGVIVIQSEAGEAHIRDLLEFGLPVVSLNHVHRLAVPQVTADYEGAMEEAFEALAADAVRKLYFVRGPWDNQPLRRYCKAGERLARRHGSAVDFEVRSMERNNGNEALLREVASAAGVGLIVDGDELARDLCNRLEIEGIVRPPMVVFSDAVQPLALPEGVLVMSSRPDATGRAAWDEMVRMLEGGSREGRVVRLPFGRGPSSDSS